MPSTKISTPARAGLHHHSGRGVYAVCRGRDGRPLDRHRYLLHRAQRSTTRRRCRRPGGRTSACKFGNDYAFVYRFIRRREISLRKHWCSGRGSKSGRWTKHCWANNRHLQPHSAGQPYCQRSGAGHRAGIFRAYLGNEAGDNNLVRNRRSLQPLRPARHIKYLCAASGAHLC